MGRGGWQKSSRKAGRHSAGHTGAPNRCSKTEYTRSKLHGNRQLFRVTPPAGYFGGRGVLAFGHPSSKGWRHLFAARSSTAVLSARGHFHVLGTRQLYRRDGGSDGDRLFDCYTGNGATYNGTWSRTATGAGAAQYKPHQHTRVRRRRMCGSSDDRLANSDSRWRSAQRTARPRMGANSSATGRTTSSAITSSRRPGTARKASTSI